MKRRESGLGLIEIMIAMVLGLVIVLGITQILVSSKQTYRVQDAAARLQEDARYVLTRMTQELRMAGMFGCLSLASGSVTDVPPEFAVPIDWDEADSTLTIVTANVATGSEEAVGADWTLTTDCKSAGAVRVGNQDPGTGEMAFPIRMVEYQYDADNQALLIKSGPDGDYQPLIAGVTNFEVTFGVASNAEEQHFYSDYTETVTDAELIRSVRIRLTLADSSGLARDQNYVVVAALRNRIL